MRSASMTVALALAFTSLSANASIIRFDLSTAIDAPPALQDWHGSGAIPSSVDLSFMIDTLSAPSLFNFGGSGPCVQNFNTSGLAATHISALSGGTSLWSAPSATLQLAGDNASGGCSNPSFFGGLTLSDGTTTYTGSLDFSSSTAQQSDLAGSSDPLAKFLSGASILSGFATFTGSFGTLVGTIRAGTIANVPEPTTLGLLLAGLLAGGVALLRRFRFRLAPVVG